MTKKKGTKADPPPIKDGGGNRITMETVVTDGPTGLARLADVLGSILKAPKDAAESREPPENS